MGNWSSTTKDSSASTVDASAFNEEKAPNQANRSAAIPNQSATADVSPPAAAVSKLKINPSNNSGMRSTDALK